MLQSRWTRNTSIALRNDVVAAPDGEGVWFIGCYFLWGDARRQVAVLGLVCVAVHYYSSPTPLSRLISTIRITLFSASSFLYWKLFLLPRPSNIVSIETTLNCVAVNRVNARVHRQYQRNSHTAFISSFYSRHNCQHFRNLYYHYSALSAGLGALYGPLISHTLPASVRHTVINVF
jgi:hypothetical protein